MSLAAEQERSGAVLERGLAAVYPSGLEAEYRSLREGCGVFDLGDRGVLLVEGPERISFLQRLLSQDIKTLKEGEGTRAALMEPKGHLVAVLRVLATRDSLALETPVACLDALEAELKHYKVGTPVRFRRPELTVVGLLGPKAASVLEGAGAQAAGLPPEGHGTFQIGGEDVRISPTGDLPGGGYALQVRPEGVLAVWRALVAKGAQETGRRALDLLRIERGCAWFPADISSENLLHETGLVRELHSPTKGCYVGQEVVARLEARGAHVNKALRGLKLESAVTEGTPLEVDGAQVGRVTTAGVSPRLGPIALAWVRRPWMELGTRCRAGSSGAEVVSLPFGDS
jgi:folate-binding protein YgfZ